MASGWQPPQRQAETQIPADGAPCMEEGKVGNTFLAANVASEAETQVPTDGTPCTEEPKAESADLAANDASEEEGPHKAPEDLEAQDEPVEGSAKQVSRALARWRAVRARVGAYMYPLSHSSAGQSADKAPRLEALDAPRWIASIQIVIYHMYEQDVGVDRARWLAFQTQLFFLLSGFVLSYVEMVRPRSQTRQLSTLEYIRKRLMAIYPLYLFSLILFVAGISGNHQHSRQSWLVLPLHIGLLHAWVPYCWMETWGPNCMAWEWNGESWFLSVLLLFWVFLRPLAEFFRNKSVLTCSVILAACWAWSGMIQFIGHENKLAIMIGCDGDEHLICQHTLMVALRAGPLGYLHVLVAGVAAARVFIGVAMCDAATGESVTLATKRAALKADTAPLFLKYGCSLGYLIYVLLVLFACGTTEEYYYFFHNGGLIPLMLLVLVGAAVGKDPLTVWLFRSKPMLVLGRISYAQYLMQHAVFHFINASFGWAGNPVGRAAFLPSLMAFAYLCERFVARPYTEYQRWKQERRPT